MRLALVTDCGVCGQPTTSKYGVCRRTRACHNEAARRQRNASPEVTPRPCEVCGLPTIGKYGVCSRTPQCLREHGRRRAASYHPERPVSQPCLVCGQPTAAKNGVCSRTVECRRECARKIRGSIPSPSVPCEVCGKITDSAGGVCKATGACRRERSRRYESEHPGRRESLQLPDRPCRYAKAGCAEMALLGDWRCRTHRALDDAQRAERRRAKLTLKLAARQDWLCSWCGLALPSDLKDAHVDHIIAQAVTLRTLGRAIDEEWNLQVLHGSCNRSKGDKFTAQALDLAAVHGLALPVAA
jgi:hypothetical protein